MVDFFSPQSPSSAGKLAAKSIKGGVQGFTILKFFETLEGLRVGLDQVNDLADVNKDRNRILKAVSLGYDVNIDAHLRTPAAQRVREREATLWSHVIRFPTLAWFGGFFAH